MKNILFAASEGMPYIKTGGLADVIGSLPQELDKQWFDVRVIMPKYACMKQEVKDKMEYVTHFYMDYHWEQVYVGVLKAETNGIITYFIDNEHYFSGDTVYTDAPKWEIERYGYFCKAVLSALPVIGFKPDVLHCNDWQTGLIPVYLKERFAPHPFYEGTKTVMTIHNLKFQGRWGAQEVEEITGLSGDFFTADKLEYFRDANLLKGGLVYADAITTVSPSYAEEIKTPYYGEGLDGLLKARSNDLRGILNGIDMDSFDPQGDASIPYPFTVENFRRRKKMNKTALQKQLGLPENDKVMMIGMISRLTDQKGFDLIEYVCEDLCQDAVQIVALGTGDARFENMLRHFAWKYPDKVSANICYSEELSHRIYAASDAFLMPSRFEPCGLSQLMALRYGTLPIVRETGGLKDTVIPYDRYAHNGTGFSFANYNAHEMLSIVRYAEKIFYDEKKEWNKMVERAMLQDFSWKRSALQYQAMYDWLTGNNI